MGYLEDFRNRIEQNDYPGFLRIWEEYCHSDEPNGDEIKLILLDAKKSDIAASFGKHVEKGLSLWRKLTDKNHINEVLKLILDLQTTNSDTLGEVAYAYLKEKYASDPIFQEKIKLIGLKPGGQFQGAISHYELLTHLQVGNFVYHSGGWGTCEITEVSKIREEVSLECDFVIGIKHLSFLNAMKTLTPLTKDHFLARRFGNPDALEKEAKENPTQVIRMLLQDLGPKTASEIKDELCDLVIPAEEWNRWWQNTRAKLKKDSKVESPKDLKDSFRLREEEVAHEVIFYKSLEERLEVGEVTQMVYTFLRDFPETLKNQEFKKSLEARLLNVLGAQGLNESQRLQLLFLLEDLGNAKSESEIKEIIHKAKSLQEIVHNISTGAFKKRALVLIRKERKDWETLFFDLLFTIDQNVLRDYLLSELSSPNQIEKLKGKLQELILHPLTFPDVFFWYFQKLLEQKKALPFANEEGICQFFEGFLILLDHLAQKPQYKDLSKRMVSLILADRYKVVREIMKIAKLKDVKEFILLATKCEALSDHDIKIIHSLAEVAHPALSKVQKESKAEENIIWTTEEGFLKTQKRIQQIATVETVQNAKEIEEARAHGDLRENAEFKSALERRDRLQAELKFLSDQINQARILTAADVHTDSVGIGTIVECKSSRGQKITYTLLGPWDADPEKNILSFQSKFAQAMKGKSVGEKFKFQQEEFLITDIQSVFEAKSVRK